MTTANASLGSTDLAEIYMGMEGYRTERLAFGTAPAKSVSIGFWFKAYQTGTFSGCYQNYANDRTYVFSFTYNTSATWQYITLTIPGDTSGTWVGGSNAGAAYLVICMASGSTYLTTPGSWQGANYDGATGTTNGVSSTSNYMQVTGVVILPGIELPSSDRAPFIARPFSQELYLCQRYLSSAYPYGTAPADDTQGPFYPTIAWDTPTSGNQTASIASIRFPVQMRDVPTISFYSSNESVYGGGTPTPGQWQWLGQPGGVAYLNANSTTSVDVTKVEFAAQIDIGAVGATFGMALFATGGWMATAEL